MKELTERELAIIMRLEYMLDDKNTTMADRITAHSGISMIRNGKYFVIKSSIDKFAGDYEIPANTNQGHDFDLQDDEG